LTHHQVCHQDKIPVQLPVFRGTGDGHVPCDACGRGVPVCRQQANRPCSARMLTARLVVGIKGRSSQLDGAWRLLLHVPTRTNPPCERRDACVVAAPARRTHPRTRRRSPSSWPGGPTSTIVLTCWGLRDAVGAAVNRWTLLNTFKIMFQIVEKKHESARISRAMSHRYDTCTLGLFQVSSYIHPLIILN
jgi:hypothetical protein